MTVPEVNRRRFLGAAAALGAAGLVRAPGAEARGAAGHAGHRVGERLPRRDDFTIRGAHVMSMDPDLGDLPDADVSVRVGAIAAVGRGLRGRGATIDGRDTIVMPGLIDTHWHMWTTLYRTGRAVRDAQAALAAVLARAGTPATTSARQDAVACCG